MGTSTNAIIALMADMLQDVERFNREIIGVPIPETMQPISEARGLFRLGHMREELDEFEQNLAAGASNERNAEMADAMIDLIYVAMGTLLEMGVVPGSAFAAVHEANMKKKRGEVAKRPGSVGFDAVKPEGWAPPDMVAACLRITPRVARNISPAFIEAAKIRATKTEDYDTGLTSKADYFPLGHASYYQMVHVKSLRLRSLVSTPREVNHESLRDTLVDLTNYASYWVEAIDKEEV